MKYVMVYSLSSYTNVSIGHLFIGWFNICTLASYTQLCVVCINWDDDTINITEDEISQDDNSHHQSNVFNLIFFSLQ